MPGLVLRKVAENPKSIVYDPVDRILAAAQNGVSREIVLIDGIVHVRVFSPYLSGNLLRRVGLRDRLPPGRGVSAWFHDFGDTSPGLGDVGYGYSIDASSWYRDTGGNEDFEAALRMRHAVKFDVVDRDVLRECERRIVENTMMSDVYKFRFEEVENLPHVDLSLLHQDRISFGFGASLKEMTRIVVLDHPGDLEKAVSAVLDAARPLEGSNGRSGIHLSPPQGPGPTFAISFPHPEMSPSCLSWQILGTKDKRPCCIAEASVSEIDASTIRPVARHSGAGFPETFHDGNGFLARSPFLDNAAPVLSDGDVARGMYRMEAESTMLDLLTDAWMLSQEPGSEDDDFNQRDAYGLSVRRSHATIRRNEDEDAASRILNEYAEHRIVRVREAGFLYRCPEPLVAVRMPAVEKPSLFVTHSWRAAAEGGSSPAFLFRLDSWDEAMDFLRSKGVAPDSWVARPEFVDRSFLSFDTDLWNVKAALCHVLGDMDGRISLMGREAVEALARTTRFLDVWKIETALSDIEGHEAVLLTDAETILSELQDPIYDDIGGEWIRDFARAAIGRARTRFSVDSPASLEDEGYLRDLAM